MLHIIFRALSWPITLKLFKTFVLYTSLETTWATCTGSPRASRILPSHRANASPTHQWSGANPPGLIRSHRSGGPFRIKSTTTCRLSVERLEIPANSSFKNLRCIASHQKVTRRIPGVYLHVPVQRLHYHLPSHAMDPVTPP